MEIEILELYTQGNILNVLIKTPYGEKKYGLGIDALNLDPETEKPRWMREIRNLLDKKYGTTKVKQKQCIECDILKKKVTLEDLSPSDEEILQNKRLKPKEPFEVMGRK